MSSSPWAEVAAAAATETKCCNYPDVLLVEFLSRSPRLARHFRRSMLMLRAMISTAGAIHSSTSQLNLRRFRHKNTP
jgi:hypothetical protein